MFKTVLFSFWIWRWFTFSMLFWVLFPRGHHDQTPPFNRKNCSTRREKERKRRGRVVEIHLISNWVHYARVGVFATITTYRRYIHILLLAERKEILLPVRSNGHSLMHIYVHATQPNKPARFVFIQLFIFIKPFDSEIYWFCRWNSLRNLECSMPTGVGYVPRKKIQAQWFLFLDTLRVVWRFGRPSFREIFAPG